MSGIVLGNIIGIAILSIFIGLGLFGIYFKIHEDKNRNSSGEENRE